MDEADWAQRNEEWLLKSRIDSYRTLDGKDVNETIECIDCDEAIPQARRKAAPGCERCVSCQEIYEDNR